MAVSNEKIFTELLEVSKAVAVMVPMVDELNRAIKGNGKPGLLERVGTIEEQHRNETKTKTSVVEMKNKRADFSTKVVLLVIGMVVSNVGVLLFAIFKP